MTPAELRAARLRLRWTQRRLALLVGVTEGAVRAWETGRAVPRPRHLTTLREVLSPDRTKVGS